MAERPQDVERVAGLQLGDTGTDLVAREAVRARRFVSTDYLLDRMASIKVKHVPQ